MSESSWHVRAFRERYISINAVVNVNYQLLDGLRFPAQGSPAVGGGMGFHLQ